VLFAFFRAIAAGELDDLAHIVESSPGLAVDSIRIEARRSEADAYFLDAIHHAVYSGDTALHICAAAYQRQTAELLVDKHARVRARNRRGAEPLHYAADGSPESTTWNPAAQRSIIEFLIAHGADPNACDNSGVAALHRAVRTRSTAAVRTLLENGAHPTMRNKRGSTPLHLAVQNTGRPDSGATASKDQQRQIIELLVQHGAKPTDCDANGKTVLAAASSDWVRAMLV
jgi:ankyrin repeat protein